MRDHIGLPIAQFKGLFQMGTDDPCPSDHFMNCLNVWFNQNEFSTRDGTVKSITLADIKRMHLYRRDGEADRLIILVTGGVFYDSINLATPILTVAAATDFSLLNFFGRAYITPHNGIEGISGEYVYVYSGSGVARRALGARPSGTLDAGYSSLSGNIEEGLRYVAVTYETDSGYLTRPGPELYAIHENPGERKCDVMNVPIGPPGTAKRHILTTKIVTNYTGDQEANEFFFVPDGTIPDNTGTYIQIDYFEADLIESADYLFDQAESAPACLGLTQYMSRMVAWGSQDNHIVRISKMGEPESFDALDGFVTVDPSDPGSVRCCVEFRNSLYMMKSQRTHVTADPLNDTNAGQWEVVSVDRGVGTEVFGVAAILDSKGTNIDKFLVADRSGILLFDGLYQRPELTYKIADWWDGVNKDYFHTIQVFNDPVKQRLYVVVPYGAATSPNFLLYGDYSDGMSAETIKWAPWQFPYDPTSIVIDTDTSGETVLRIASIEDNIYDLTPGSHSDDGTAIDSYAETGFVTVSDIGELCHFAGIRLRVFGSGSLELLLSGEDSVGSEALYPIALSTAPGAEKVSLASLTEEKVSLKLRTHLFGEWFRVNRIIVFGKVLWAAAPYGE